MSKRHSLAHVQLGSISEENDGILLKLLTHHCSTLCLYLLLSVFVVVCSSQISTRTRYFDGESGDITLNVVLLFKKKKKKTPPPIYR